MMSSGRLRLLTYSHDGFGLGHFRRNLRLIRALQEEVPDVTTLMLTGSSASHYFDLPPNVDYVKLPSLAKMANDHYVSRPLNMDKAAITGLRSSILEAAMAQFAPDLVLVDFYPLGVNRELETALERLRADRPSTHVVLGWRDILDDPAQVQREWGDTGHLAAVERLFDQVLVYGTKAVYDPITEYSLPRSVAERTMFTGYLVDHCGPTCRRTRRRAGYKALCTLGGGEDGRAAGDAFLKAMAMLGPNGWLGLLVTGPLMPQRDQQYLQEQSRRIGVSCVAFVDDLPTRMAESDIVVAMAGYNTVCEVFGVGTPCILIPRTKPRQEQLLRATRLAKLGWVDVWEANSDPVTALAERMCIAATRRPSRTRRVGPDLGTSGLRRSAMALASLIRPVAEIAL